MDNTENPGTSALAKNPIIERRIDNLMKSLGGHVNRDEAAKALVFGTTMFMISRDKSRGRIVDSLLRRPGNALTPDDADIVYDFLLHRFALDQYGNDSPELIRQLNEIFGNVSNSDGDYVIGGEGPYGVSITNPIPVKGIAGESDYLTRLRTKDGQHIKWKRLGSGGSKNIKNPIDIFMITDLEGKELPTIYISPYSNRTSGTAPEGYKIE